MDGVKRGGWAGCDRQPVPVRRGWMKGKKIQAKKTDSGGRRIEKEKDEGRCE